MIYKCKMCGGELDIAGKEHVCECPFCGVTQTIPDVDEEKALQLYNRATFLLKSCEYDKASSIYERIIADQGEQAESYWGLCLCKYGIEYVDDPKTGKKIPTCHRTLTDSILKDGDYLKALDLADVVARKLYREEAEYIDAVQKRILEVSKTEEPYDVFICYKESDKAGRRTVDSVLAEEIYDALTEKGYRAFFSRISLEDKIGQEYEPFIFAALTSAKVMLAIGTREEFFNAPWVKNEWSRFLKLCNKGEKKYLIPCYKDISPYEMPEEFVNLQAQDLGKIGYLQDLTKGIDKLFERTAHKQKTSSDQKDEGDLVHSTFKELRRMLLFVGDSKHFDKKEFTDKWSILYTLEDPSDSMEPKKAPLAFSCDFLYVNQLPNYQYSGSTKAFDAMWYLETIDFKKLEKDEPELCKEIQGFLKEYSVHRGDLENLEKYDKAIALKKTAKTPDDYLELSKAFGELGDFRDSKRQAEFYKNKAKSIIDSSLNDFLYTNLIKRISRFNTESEKEEILNGFKEISEYKDSSKYISAFEFKDPALYEEKTLLLTSKKQLLINGDSEIQELKKQIDIFEKQLAEEIAKTKRSFNDEKALLENEISDIRKDYIETSQKLSECGLFAVKEKKLLRDRLVVLEAELMKAKRENGRQLQELENKSNESIESLQKACSQKITDVEKQIEEIIDSNEEIKAIETDITECEKELENARKNGADFDSLRKLWAPDNVFVTRDYWGFEILVIKLGKYPQSKVMIPSLLNELKALKPDQKGFYHLHGLEFFIINKTFYLVEPIEWKFIKHTNRNGKDYYLLTTRCVLDVRGPMLKENVVKVKHDATPCEYLTKDEHEPVSLYKFSDIRKWLTKDFFSLAFNEEEKKVICVASLDNSADSTSDEATIFCTDNTEDRIFLPSFRAVNKTHLGDGFYEDINSELGPVIEKENAFVEDELIPSIGLDPFGITRQEYREPKNAIYDDDSELCWSNIYSDYSIELTKVEGYREGCLLRSPDTESITGYNTCRLGKANSYGGQFEDGSFSVTNDIVPCILLCFNNDGKVVFSDEDFDF